MKKPNKQPTKILKLARVSWQWLRRKWKLVLIVLVLLAGIGVWQYRRLQANKVEYNTIQPTRQRLEKTLEISGVVDAQEKARLRFIAGGKVTYLGAQEGDWVDKWQTIARIDPATLNKQLQQDLNNYLLQRYDADQYIDDTRENYWEQSTVRVRTDNQLGLENEVLDVEIRDIAIKNTAVTAPFAGVLTASPSRVTGVQLLSTDYFELVNPNTLVFKATVDEADVSLVSLGQTTTITLDAFPDEEISSQVSYVAFTSSQSSTGTVFLVEFPLQADSLAKYRLGMNGDAAISLEVKDDVLVIPLDSTRERDDQVFVDVLDDSGQLQERQITTGLETDELIEVLTGLSESDRVVLPE